MKKLNRNNPAEEGFAAGREENQMRDSAYREMKVKMSLAYRGDMDIALDGVKEQDRKVDTLEGLINDIGLDKAIKLLTPDNSIVNLLKDILKLWDEHGLGDDPEESESAYYRLKSAISELTANKI